MARDYTYTADGRRIENGSVADILQPDDLWKDLFRRNFVSRMNGFTDDIPEETDKLADLSASDPSESEDVSNVSKPRKLVRF